MRGLRGKRRDDRGQSLAEFALVFPFFMVILFGVVEFAFALNTLLSIDFATRDAALIAAEAGNTPGADCSILQKVEDSVTAPADRNRITEVQIYKSDPNGKPVVPNRSNIYARGGGSACPGLPYKLTSAGYLEGDRCNTLAGCPTQGSTTVDTIGVQMTLVYTWKTPLPNFIPMAGPGYTMTKSNAMRMEPVL